MKLINIRSRRGAVNLFADFIMQKINKNSDDKTVIQVTDCNNFYVINGCTTVKQIQDLTSIKNEFIRTYSYLLDFDFSKTNLIDLIKYDYDVKTPKQLSFTYFNSERPIYNDLVIKNKISGVESLDISNNNLKIEINEKYVKDFLPGDEYSIQTVSIQSEFPYGYSLSSGRGVLYYLENVMYELKSGLICKYILFNIKINTMTSISLNTDSVFPTENITSMVYDLFDFDFKSFQEKISSYNLCEELTNPLSKKIWLEKKIHPNDKLVF